MHKIIYESLSRMLYNRFIDWMDQERPLTVKEVNCLLEEAKKDINASDMTDFKGENVIKDLNKYFKKYRDDIKQDGTDLQKYWLSYLEMIELWQLGVLLVMYVTEGANCWKITENEFEEVPILSCSHEEADTRMLLHAKLSDGPVIVHSDDTDVFILLLAHLENLPKCYMKLGKGAKSRLLDMSSIHAGIAANYEEDLCSALIGLHAFTGCDSISSFAGKGKIEAINLLKKYPEFIQCFEALGQTWIVTERQIINLTRFVYTLYGKKIDDVDLLSYQIFCTKGGRIDPESLLPCLSTLMLHIKRANYQALVWRNALRRNPLIPSPDGHG